MMMLGGVAWIFLIFSTGIGVPVGLPPAPLEEYMFEIAPEECLFFTTWASMAEIDPTSENLTERLMAEKQIQELVAKAEAAFRKSTENSGGRRATDAAFTEAMPDVTRTILTRATTAFIEDFELREGAPHVSGGFVVSLGKQEAKIRDHLTTVNEALSAENDLVAVKIAGSSFIQLKIAEGDNLLTWGIHDGRLMFGAGEGMIEKIIERAETDEPKWLTDTRKELTVKRVATVSYIDIQSIIGKSREMGGGGGEIAMIFTALDNFGITSLKSYRSVTGMESQGLVDRTIVDFDGERKGLFKAIGSSELKAENLKKLPKDPLVALAVQLDLKKVYDMIDDDPSLIFMSAEMMNEMIDSAEDVIGADFRDELIGSFGDAVYIYTAPNDGGLLTGWTLAVDVDQSMTLDQIMQRVIGFANAAMLVGRDDSVRIKTQIVDGNDVHYLVFKDSFMPFSFSFSLVNDQLLFSLYPQAIKGHIARQKSSPGLDENAEIAALFSDEQDGNLTTLTYIDMQELARQVYPFLVGVSSQLAYANEREDIGISPADIPPVDVIAKHLRPAVSTTYAHADSYHTTTRHVLPTGNIGSNVPAMTAMMLPAITAAREAARRTQSANNLRQIGLGLHNYHDVYRAFPPAYSTGKDGKPLLSWRVHILPYVEQQPLYDQFHLDEPWDSDHNKALIEKMPEFLKTPGLSEAEIGAGKTVYVGVAGENCIFGPESITDKAAEDNPKGHMILKILDGTSNTLMVLEANKDSAVTWTKPDDFDAPGMNPIGRMMGTFNGGTNVLHADGSVQFINEDIDLQILTNMFQMNDGKSIYESPIDGRPDAVGAVEAVDAAEAIVE